MSTSPRTPLLRRIHTTAHVMASAFFATSLALAPRDLLQSKYDTGSFPCACPCACSGRSSQATGTTRPWYQAP